MTQKLFESYKIGKYKPYNRYYIETYKPVFIPEHRYPFNGALIKSKMSSTIPVNDTKLVSVTFNGNYITYSITELKCVQCNDRHKGFNCLWYAYEAFSPYTITVHYKNIKAFH